MPGRFAEGPRHPGFILPASAVSEQENRKNVVCSGFVSSNPETVEKPATSLLRRAEIRNVRSRLPLRPMFRRAIPCAARGLGSVRGPAPQE